VRCFLGVGEFELVSLRNQEFFRPQKISFVNKNVQVAELPKREVAVGHSSQSGTFKWYKRDSRCFEQL